MAAVDAVIMAAGKGTRMKSKLPKVLHRLGGRALLARKDGVWSITLCGGPDLRAPEFLAANGVKDADMLSQMFNTIEDQMGADKVAFSSKFPQVVMMSTPPAN